MMMKPFITAATTTAAVILTGCTGTTEGTPLRDPTAPTTSTAVAAPLSTETTAPAAQTPGLRDDALPPTISIIETAPGGINTLVSQAFSDVIGFWESTADVSFTAPQRLEALDGPIPQSTCMRKLDVARRCDEGIGWETADMATLRQRSGDLGVLTIVAHEVGHEVQADNGRRDAERGADCLAGVYLRSVTNGRSPRFVGTETDVMDAATAAFDAFKRSDTAPTSSRMSALRNGFQRSADFCLAKYP